MKNKNFLRIISWNVNGIRACIKKGLLDYIEQSSPDILCLQETKAHIDQVDLQGFNRLQYDSYWNSAVKKGYSGVANFYQSQPIAQHHGLGVESLDQEGRIVTQDYGSFLLINGYFPNGQRDHGRVQFKLEFYDVLLTTINEYRKQGREVIVCGDFNTAHQAIDLKNAKANENTSGFLPEERQWVTRYLESGLVDVFRKNHPDEEGHYTWWTYRANARPRNIGWRIDYFLVTPGLEPFVHQTFHHPHVLGSDHCPVGLDLDRSLLGK